MDSDFSALVLIPCIMLLAVNVAKVSGSNPLHTQDAGAAISERVRRADVSPVGHLYNEARINHFSDEEEQAILDKHLEYRSSVDPEASNMQYMEWNDDLAYLAGLWASVCYAGHGFTNHTDIIAKFPHIGQNLWSGSSTPNGISDGVEDWHDNEVNNYDYAVGECSGVCGHYTQVVWATSNEVGCGRAYCQQKIGIDGNPDTGGRGGTPGWILICNYAPAGNFIGQKPYESGASCSECPTDRSTCTNKMCAESTDDSEPSTSAPETTPKSMTTVKSTASGSSKAATTMTTAGEDTGASESSPASSGEDSTTKASELNNCNSEANDVQSTGVGDIPQCETNGDYKPRQCDGSTSFCWCVDTKTGEEKPGTRLRLAEGEIMCDGSSRPHFTSGLIIVCSIVAVFLTMIATNDMDGIHVN